ncbi:hypothetical protein HKD37_08G021160 [Glycine soja]
MSTIDSQLSQKLKLLAGISIGSSTWWSIHQPPQNMDISAFSFAGVMAVFAAKNPRFCSTIALLTEDI